MADRAPLAFLSKIGSRWLYGVSNVTQRWADSISGPTEAENVEDAAFESEQAIQTQSESAPMVSEEPDTTQSSTRDDTGLNEPPPHWMERVRSSNPPQHWLNDVQKRMELSADDSLLEVSELTNKETTDSQTQPENEAGGENPPQHWLNDIRERMAENPADEAAELSEDTADEIELEDESAKPAPLPSPISKEVADQSPTRQRTSGDIETVESPTASAELDLFPEGDVRAAERIDDRTDSDKPDAPEPIGRQGSPTRREIEQNTVVAKTEGINTEPPVVPRRRGTDSVEARDERTPLPARLSDSSERRTPRHRSVQRLLPVPPRQTAEESAHDSSNTESDVTERTTTAQVDAITDISEQPETKPRMDTESRDAIVPERPAAHVDESITDDLRPVVVPPIEMMKRQGEGIEAPKVDSANEPASEQEPTHDRGVSEPSQQMNQNRTRARSSRRTTRVTRLQPATAQAEQPSSESPEGENASALPNEESIPTVLVRPDTLPERTEQTRRGFAPRQQAETEYSREDFTVSDDQSENVKFPRRWDEPEYSYENIAASIDQSASAAIPRRVNESAAVLGDNGESIARPRLPRAAYRHTARVERDSAGQSDEPYEGLWPSLPVDSFRPNDAAARSAKPSAYITPSRYTYAENRGYASINDIEGYWPSLPDNRFSARNESQLQSELQARKRMSRLDDEQRGVLWNESPF